jgi:hypothetical protein
VSFWVLVRVIDILRGGILRVALSLDKVPQFSRSGRNSLVLIPYVYGRGRVLCGKEMDSVCRANPDNGHATIWWVWQRTFSDFETWSR